MNLNFLLAGAASGNVIQIVMIVGMIAIFYFLLIRPQKKQEKAANAMRDALQIGDEVTTIGGIIGAIVSIKEETDVIETTRDGTKIRFLRSAIRSVDVKAEDAQKN
jgi:preprotein translocase subunit YajC